MVTDNVKMGMHNCLYVLFYRGPLGRLAILAKSATLSKYCIN